MNSRMLQANLAAFVSALLFGSSVVAVRSIGMDVPPFLLATLRFAQGGLLLLALLAVGAPRMLRIARRDVRSLVLIGGLFCGVFPVLFNLSLRMTEASRGALMIATTPLWSALFGRVFGSELLAKRQVVGILLSFAGVTLVLLERGLQLEGQGTALLGDALMLLAAITGVVSIMLMKRMLHSYHSLPVTAYLMLSGVLVLLPFTVAEVAIAGQSVTIDRHTTLLIVFLGVFSGALGYFLWTFGLSRLSPTPLLVYINLNPMTAALLGAVLLDEQLSLVFIVAFALVLAGVVVANWPQRETSPRVIEDSLSATGV